MNFSISKSIQRFLTETFNIDASATYFLIAVIMILLSLFCVFLTWKLFNWILKRWVPNFTARTKTIWDDVIFSPTVLKATALLIPALLLDFMAPYLFADFENALPIISGATKIFIVFAVAWIINSIFDSVSENLADSEDFRDKPIASFTQLGRILVYAVAFLLILSILFSKSPLLLLSGFGAIAAVVLLVFKDSILGFVASVQLSANNMVHVGDWVTVPKFGADGDVLEINLTTIKIQNFDKTISTIPTYAFVADSFKNWRGMTQAPGRRIKRAIVIKIQSINFCTPEMISRFKKIQLVQEYIDQRSKEIEKHNEEHRVDGSVLINGRNMTNIGTFAVYLENYLLANPNINKEMTIMVRQLSPTENGVPVEIYAFSKHKEWKTYEGIIADIFDHIMAGCKYFDLEIFENPTGSDFQKLSA